jgi:hypothetical protein
VRKLCIAIVCAGSVAVAAAPASAANRACPSASAGPTSGDSTFGSSVYRSLETRNLSCRKGERIMDAFARRYGWPPPDGSFTWRFQGFRCKVRFATIEENGRFLADGTVACRKGTRRVQWVGAGAGSPGGGAPD